MCLFSNWQEVDLEPRQCHFKVTAHGSSVNAGAGECFMSQTEHISSQEWFEAPLGVVTHTEPKWTQR